MRLQSREQSGLQSGLQSRAAGAHGGTGTPRSRRRRDLESDLDAADSHVQEAEEERVRLLGVTVQQVARGLCNLSKEPTIALELLRSDARI